MKQFLKKSKIRLSKTAYSKLCKSMLKRDGFKCRRCKTRNNLSTHHIIFRSQQGEDTSQNLITLCQDDHDRIHKSKTLVILPLVEGKPINANKGVKWQLSLN